MGPKKKSKANKLARMSEEERLRYLQHRAAMEEEAQRRKQELISTYLKTKLKHEEAFTRLNSAKINQQWRHILRQIKCKELKEDIETLKQRSEIVLECKSKVIENLLQDFDRAEFQYSLQFKSHMENISKFMDIHKIRMTDLHDWYSQQLQYILEKSNEDENKFLMETQNDTHVIQTTKTTEGNSAQQNLEKMRANFEERKSELQTKLLYKMTKLEEKYADELNGLKQKYENVLDQYKQNTDTKQVHYKILAEKDDTDSLEIIRHFKEIANYMQRIQQTKTDFEELEEKHRLEISDLEHEKRKITQQLQTCQKLNNQNVAQDQVRLKVLVNISNSVIKDLNSLTQIGQKLVNLSEKCDKIKTQKQQHDLPQITKSEKLADQETSYDRLQQFWKNYNQAKISNETLRIRNVNANIENKKLRKLLRFYMASIRRSSSVPRKCGY